MIARGALRLAFCCAALIALLGATGPSGCERGTLYVLRPESAVTQGCFEPCMCPIALFEGLRGTFGLVERVAKEPALFREFDVVLVRWALERGEELVPIRGSGRYRVGGEFASLQQMELDLSIGDQPVQHFDSGLVVGGGGFPELDVRVSVNGLFCYDTVIDVVASPLASKS